MKVTGKGREGKGRVVKKLMGKVRKVRERLEYYHHFFCIKLISFVPSNIFLFWSYVCFVLFFY